MTKALRILPVLIFYSFLGTAQNFAFTNGNWFNGASFAPATWYSINGTLTKKAPATIDSTFDLSGQWVVPPLADAFCSSVSENPSAEHQMKFYLNEGIFYLQVLGNTQDGRKTVDSLVRANAVHPDFKYANGAFTCTLGYPFLKYEGPAQGVRNPQMFAQQYSEIREGRKMLGDGYWFVDSKAAVNKIWKSVVDQKPDVVSIYLLDANNSGGKESKGLTPDVAKALVKKARRSKLPVYAHVETAEDVRLGLKLGVQGFANLPGYNWDGKGDNSKYALNDDDLKKLAKKKTAVIPLFSYAQTHSVRPEATEAQSSLLKRMLNAGVNVVIGSDDAQRTIRSEVNYWFQFGNLNYAQILNVLCVNTPQAIFPDRKIGRFEEGYEASFLVLRDNPLGNLLKLRAINMMVKQGKLLPK
ncbi:MAG: amidohydrolase family protein [Saprospiraceae bacterium]|nr:amidohydrolase family protein [Saprospiraceae bacterium]